MLIFFKKSFSLYLEGQKAISMSIEYVSNRKNEGSATTYHVCMGVFLVGLEGGACQYEKFLNTKVSKRK